MQIWAESGKSALPICNYSQILYQFLTFTQNLKRSRFFVPQLIKLQLVIRHDLPKLGNIKGSQSCTAGNQDAFGCLA